MCIFLGQAGRSRAPALCCLRRAAPLVACCGTSLALLGSKQRQRLTRLHDTQPITALSRHSTAPRVPRARPHHWPPPWHRPHACAPVHLFCFHASAPINKLAYCPRAPCRPPFSSPVSHAAMVLCFGHRRSLVPACPTASSPPCAGPEEPPHTREACGLAGLTPSSPVSHADVL
jgi:hypothetical protein